MLSGWRRGSPGGGEGERNRGLFWAACRLAENGVSPADALDALGRCGTAAGLGDREIATTVRSAYRATQPAPEAAPAAGASAGRWFGARRAHRPQPWEGGAVMKRSGPRRWAAMTAVAGTVFIAAGAFWLSFTSLADLAARSGIGAGQAWAWPLIVDGIIVVATVAVVALAGQRSAWYPWALLVGGALVSVTANAIHAVVAADADVPSMLAASVAAVPPVVLLAITHLTVILTRTTDPDKGTRRRRVVLDETTAESMPALPSSETEAELAVAMTVWRIGGRWGGSCARRAGRTSGSPANSGCIPRPWAAGSPSRTSLTPPTPPTSGRRRPHEHH
jgi:hypothetical protein